MTASTLRREKERELSGPPCPPSRHGYWADAYWANESAVPRKTRIGAGGKVEAAGTALSTAHLRDAHLDAPLSGILIPGGVDPPNPFPSRHRRDRLPEVFDRSRGIREGLSQIRWHAGFRPIFGWFDFDGRHLAGSDPSGLSQPSIDPHPVTKVAIRFENCPKGVPIDRSVDRHLPPRWHFNEEFYLFSDLAEDRHDLLGLEFGHSHDGSGGQLLPLSWCIERGPMRAFYTALGHFGAAYENVDFVRHLGGGVSWTLFGSQS